MTINEIISFVGTNKLNKSDKDTEILRGINWVKDDLLGSRLKRQWKTGTNITLTANQYDNYDLPSDFGILDKLQIVLSETQKYFLWPAHNAEEITDNPLVGTYPNKYFLYGNNKFMVGDPTPGSALTLRPFYYAKITDYTVASNGSDTPILADIYGPELYISGALAYVWDCMDQYATADRERTKPKGYYEIKADILGIEMHKGAGTVQPNPIF